MSGFGMNGGSNRNNRSKSQGANLQLDSSGAKGAPIQVDRRAALSRKLEQSKSAATFTPTKIEKSGDSPGKEEEWGISGLLGREVHRKLASTFDAAFGAIGGLSNGLEGAAADAAGALGLDGKGKHQSKKGAKANHEQVVKRVLLDRRQSLTMCIAEENVRQAMQATKQPSRRTRPKASGMWGALQSFQEKMTMMMHVDDQLSEVAKSGQQLQLLIKKDEKDGKDGDTSSTTSSDDEDDTTAEVQQTAEEQKAAEEEAKRSYQFSSGTRQLSTKEVEVLLAKGCLDAEEVRRLRSRLKELESGVDTQATKATSAPPGLPQSAGKGAPPELAAKGKGKGPPPPGVSMPVAEAGAVDASKSKGKAPGPPAPAGKGGAPPPPTAGGKGGPPAPPGKGKGKGAQGLPAFGRKWHWKSFQAHETQSTIWGELLQNAGGEGAPKPWRVDVSSMRDIFKEIVDPNAKKIVAKEEPVKTEIKVFDAKRAQNLAIGLMGLKNNCNVDLDDVARAVSNLDGTSNVIGSMEVIELLATLLPSPDEAKGLAAVPEDQRENLRDVEKQMWLLSRVPRLPARLRVLFFEKKQVDLEADAKERLQLLALAAHQARSSKAFRSFLTVCLSIGNFVNHTDRKSVV